MLKNENFLATGCFSEKVGRHKKCILSIKFTLKENVGIF